MSTQVTKVKNEEGQESGGTSLAVRSFAQRALEYPRRFRQFLHEVRVEMKQVTWPTWADVRATTAVVIVTVFFFGLYLFVVDLGVSRLVEQVIQFFKS